MKVTTDLSTQSPRFVLERTLEGGVHVCASHPQVGPVYWRVFDNSDVGLPDDYSLTMDVGKALRLPANWRNHWYYGPKYSYLANAVMVEDVKYDRVEHFGPPERNEDYEYYLEHVGLPEVHEICDNGLNEYIPRFSGGALHWMVQRSGVSPQELLDWLISAEWKDVPAATARVYLEDMNGFVGYTPVWTDDIARALTLHEDDPELDLVLGYGRLVRHQPSNDMSQATL
ncbi:hypothetical protein ACXIUT_25035 [Achromobacter denitrificans]